MWGSGLIQNQMLFGKSEKPFQPAEADGRAPGAWFCLVFFLLKQTFCAAWLPSACSEGVIWNFWVSGINIVIFL